jgi:NAD-dependent dihydropyrimidine dehydrogenase PreA subunit
MPKEVEIKNDWTTDEIDETRAVSRAITIPVSITIEGKQKVLSFSQAEAILKKARLISLEPCWCRLKLKNCDAPVDVCICTDEEAKLAITERDGHEATLNEAMAALERSHKAGLVHLAFARKGYDVYSICGCCSCCCHSMAAITRFGYNKEFVEHSDVIARHHPETCKNCQLCVSKCHFKAWDLVGGKVKLYSKKCGGCGVCASFCPTGSIELVSRKKDSGKTWVKEEGNWVLVDAKP